MGDKRAGHLGLFCCLMLAGVVVLAPVRARGQEVDEEPVAVPEQAVEAYLERLGLKRLLADLLEKRLASTPKDVRVAPAERLGRIYVDLLGSAATSSERQFWEEKAKALLAQVPDADSFDLRLSLGKAVYARAEEIAERNRLRMATPEEVAEAEKVFRGLVTQFGDIASKSHRRVDTLERVEQTGEATERALTDLADARRQRSLAFYFAGWANYYLALLTRADQPAVDAARCFGWLLNSGSGRPATPDRIQGAMFQYEHVARAAVGCALCASLRGNDIEALRWLDAVADSDQTPEAVREQLAPRRFVVLGAAKRWADLELFVRRTRKADRNGGGPELTPLSTSLARLLAVITLEADKRNAGPQIEALAKIALADLVARKEVAQVLDLVSKFGTAPIGDSGFIVYYVRALGAYDTARKRHEEKQTAADDPTDDPLIANQYKSAASMFEAADQQPDADQFGVERVRAATMHGRSLFFAGDLTGAADAFTAAWKLVGKGPAGEEPLWLGVLALERAAKEPTAPEAVKTRLNQTITLFLQNYPESEKAPRLTLMQVALGSLGDDEALKVLTGVPKDSPVYEASRRQVARILYNRFRAARGPEKDFAAARFVAVAEDVLAADRKIALENKIEDAKQAVERVVVRSRQLLDALLGVSSPDVSRAESVLKILTGVASFNNYDLKPVLAELTFRELQIAEVRNDADQMESTASRLATTTDAGGQFQAAGERLMYRHFAIRYKPGPDKGDAQIQLARSVVKYGIRVIDRIGADSQQMKDASSLAAYNAVAGAAMEIAAATGETQMRDLAIKLDRSILGVQPRNEASLRRLAAASEQAGDLTTASANWRVILGAVAPSTEAWFEAKYQTTRLLSKADADKAREALREHLILYPNGGPEPWGSKFLELDHALGPIVTPPPASTGAPAASPATGAGGTP